ncbi:MAG: O-antigen ligase family protein [Blastocatellia bacterium]
MTPGQSFGKYSLGNPSLSNNEAHEEDGPVSSELLQPTSSNSIILFDRLSAIETQSTVARWLNRALILFLFLFAISLPHSIAAAQISLGAGMILWLARDVVMQRFHLAHTPIDLPLLCFAGLTVLSSVFSVEPSISLPKLKGLVLFGTIYLMATNLRSRSVHLMVGLLIVSSLLGVGFSLVEKLWGRGMIITTIDVDSPLSGSDLRPGDVIWMIGRHRVFSTEAADAVIRRERAGKQIEIEALHAGDPVPVKLTVTDELKAKSNPLGITTSGRSRQFRVSGFSRQFLTYAEQMQMLALLVYGGILTSLAASLRQKRKRGSWLWIQLYAVLFVLFGLALVLTASRAVIAAAIGALLIVSVSVGRRALLIALMAALVLGALGVYVIGSARRQTTTSFSDDSTARRIGYMRAGLRVIPQHPLLGVGMDSHKRHWQEWGFPGSYVTHTHSTPIQIAMDRGLPALACYCWLIAAMLIVAWRGFKRANQESNIFNASLMLGAFGALIGFSLSSLTNYNFGDSEVLMLLLFIVGLLLAANRPNLNDQFASGLDGFAQ